MKKLISGVLLSSTAVTAFAEVKINTIYTDKPLSEAVKMVEARLQLAELIGPERMGMKLITPQPKANDFASKTQSCVTQWFAGAKQFYMGPQWCPLELKDRNYMDTTVYDKVNLLLGMRTATMDLGRSYDDTFTSFIGFYNTQGYLSEFLMLANKISASGNSNINSDTQGLTPLFSFKSGNGFSETGEEKKSCAWGVIVQDVGQYVDTRICSIEYKTRDEMEATVFNQVQYTIAVRAPTTDLGKSNTYSNVAFSAFYTPDNYAKHVVTFKSRVGM